MVALHLLLACAALGADNQPALLNFTAPNCSHCRLMEPVLARLEAEGMPVQTIDVAQHPEMAQRFKVTGTPTFVMLVGGREVNRIVGSTTAERLKAAFPVSEAPPEGDIRGQSPNPQSSSFVNERLGGFLGKGAPTTSPPANNVPSGGDPFASRQSFGSDAVAPKAPLPRTASPQQGLDPQARAMAASVRLKVEDANGHSLGSGTIIDTHGEEAVLVTCGHIFRESKGQGRISVDLFHPQVKTIEGKLLGYDLKRDIAIVSITPGAGAVAAPVAKEGMSVAKNDVAFSIGCDKGQDPSVRQTRINGLNRYQGPPNIEAAGAPVDGRSGGGLFSQEGHLIGVCNAADPAEDEGIYAAIATIHWQLDQVGLTELYQAGGDALAAVEPTPAVESLASPAVSPRTTVQPAPLQPVPGGSEAGDAELIVIVRSKSNPSAKGQMFVIPRASQSLLKQLADHSADPLTAADLALNSTSRSAMTPIRSAEGATVRGQSRR